METIKIELTARLTCSGFLSLSLSLSLLCVASGMASQSSQSRAKTLPRRLLLVGLPGSGKSTLASHIVQHFPGACRVSQDDCGRSGFSAMLTHPSTRTAPLVVIDRCNTSVAQRAEFSHDSGCWVLVLATSPDDCICRVRQRTSHPTLSPAKAAEVVSEMAASFEPVTDAERFGSVFHLDSTEAVDAFLSNHFNGMPPLGESVSSSEEASAAAGSLPLHKFPRTQHLTDLGSATRDDLVMDQQALADFLAKPVVVEEKIDGANLGISIDPETYEVRFQNRSHYVNSATASQFKKLGQWVVQHRESLFDVIEPGRHVLFGEWLPARHTIPYDSLPGYFIAFDLLDTVDGIFFSRRRLERALGGTTIPLIRVITEEVPKTIDRLVSLASSPSTYYTGPVEGIVVRLCDEQNGSTLMRGKIVRPNFLQPSSSGHDGAVKHWTSRVMEENRLGNR